MTGKTKWISGLVTVMLFLVLIGGFIVQQNGWFPKVGQNNDNAAKTAGIKVSLTGRVVEITDSVLILAPEGVGKDADNLAKGKQVELAIKHTTRYEKTTFDSSGIPTRRVVNRQYVKKNDVVSIDALLEKGESLVAAMVIVSPRPDEKTATPMNGYTGGSVINGAVDSLKDNGFLVKTENGEDLVVTLDKSVNIMLASQGQRPKEGKIVDISVGDKISVMGVRQTSGEFLARQIMCVK